MTRRLQFVLVAFFVLAAASFVVIYLVTPEIYVQTLMLKPRAAESHPAVVTAFMVAILALVTVLAVGVLRRWRWLFWLVLAAFGASALDIPGTILELVGVIPIAVPLWYALARMAVAAIQVMIAIWMLRLYRRHGVWASGAPSERR